MTQSSSSTNPKVTVFSTLTCPYCVQVKQYLDSKGVAYSDVNVGIDQGSAMAMIRRSGQMGVPQLWIGDEVVVGFDRNRINQLLALV
jgi:glutaredoxin-like YruB-family protein